MNQGRKVLVAGYLAIGFLLLRQLYALVFNGLEGDGLLLSLPQLQLPQPFSYITLFGEVSLEGVIRNFEIGLPLAASIFTLGVLAAFVTQRQLIAASKKLPAIKNVLTALAIGLAVIPALFDASKKVFSALSLRGESKRLVLVPILERAVEIANALGLKITLEAKPKSGQSGITVRNLQIADTDIAAVSFEVRAGEIVALTGATGSGKTSILEAVAGIAGEYRGRKVAGETTRGAMASDSDLAKLASFIGFIPQNPRELCLGLTTKELVDAAPKELLERLGVAGVSAHDSAHLSEGEIFKLVLAGVLARKPSILVLDEPFGALDSRSREVVSEILNEFASAGGSVLIAEHEPNQILGLAATCYQVSERAFRPGRYQPELPNPARTVAVVGNEQVLDLQLSDLVRGRLLVAAPRIKMGQAECVWLSGENGSGKSSLLAEIAKTTKSGPAQIALVPENFDDFFVTATLCDELLRADLVAGVAKGFTKTTLGSILPEGDIDNWLAIHPRDLSRGTRLALAIAMQLSHKPKVLLVDEPFRGLDPRAKDQISETIRCVQETGCAVLFASHEQHWSTHLATRRLGIFDQQLIEIASVRA